MKTKTITKYFDKMSDAEQYQNRLYRKHYQVTLISFPRFGEAGTYTWEIR